jgi:hypothetical protein
MKFSEISLLVLGTAATSEGTYYRHSNASQDRINIFGFDEGDMYDFVEGWATGWFHRDMKADWGACLEAVPDLMLGVMTPSGSRESISTLLHPMNALKAIGDVSGIAEIAHLGNWLQHSVDEAESLPRELATCHTIYNDLHDSSLHLGTSPSIWSLSRTFLSQPYQHSLDGFILVGKVFGSLHNHDLFDTGKAIADTMWLVFGNDELLAWMEDVKKQEADALYEEQMKEARARLELEKERKFWEDSIDMSRAGRARYEKELEEMSPGIKAAREYNDRVKAKEHQRDLERAAEWAAEEQRDREERAAREERERIERA